MVRLALVLAAAVLTLRASAARAEPLDFDLSRMGAPDPTVWIAIGERAGGPAILPGEAATYAADAKQRFAILSSEVALAMSGPILTPASTTGHAGFDVAAEGGWTPVHADPVGVVPPGLGFTNRLYASSAAPTSLTTAGLHVRKALPFSFELGGRLTYLSQSSYFAAQGEAKWAFNEGFKKLPDFAVRAAYTRLFGQRDWNLGTTDLDFMVSKRWGVNAVTSFTPYVAARFSYVNASSNEIDFWTADQLREPDKVVVPAPPDELGGAVARFPNLSVGFYRTTLGVRMTANVVSLAAEATWFGGKKDSGPDAASLPAGEYPTYEIESALAYAVKLGFEF